MATGDEWDRLRDDVRAAAVAFADGLRGVTDPGQRVPNLDWSVAELAAHLACLPAVYRAQHQIGEDFEPPEDWARFSNASRAHITTTDVDELATLLLDEVETLLIPDDPNEPRLLYGCRTTVFNTAAGVLTELVLHGQDLGRLTGQRPELTRAQALAGLEQQMVLTPVFVDAAKAAKLAGTYGFRFRGGLDMTYRIDEAGAVTVERGRPPRADARINADPVTFLATSLGRVHPVMAALRGGVVAYGRKPWRMARLGNVVVDGV